MAQMCAACDTCNDNPMEALCGGLYLEPFQNSFTSFNQLSKVNQFFTVVCTPFHQIDIREFYCDICEIMKLYGTEESSNSAQDTVPYISILEYFQNKPIWGDHVENE